MPPNHCFCVQGGVCFPPLYREENVQTRVTLWFKGLIWCLIGLVLSGVGVSLSSWLWFGLGIFLLIYGVVLIVQDRMVRSQVSLSTKELEKWGERLAASTPAIVEQLEAQETPASIARQLEKDRGIPPEITLRYIIALAEYEA